MAEKLPRGTNFGTVCVVCNDLATGNHYNVPSCNGCKTFFRRAVVNNRTFACRGSGMCPVNKGVRCACRHCRLKKCLEVGMDRRAIQNDRDRIGYTKRIRKKLKTMDQIDNDNNTINNNSTYTSSPTTSSSDESDLSYSLRPTAFEWQQGLCDGTNQQVHDSTAPLQTQNMQNMNILDPILERLTMLENNFTLLLSRANIEPYASLEDALTAPSRFNQSITVKMTDPVVSAESEKHQHKMAFWRSRIIALYIDWAKTFALFQKLPHSDKVVLITNHASSFMIMCETFRTPQHINDKIVHPDGHCFTRNPPPDSLFFKSLSGLTPVMAAMIDYVMQPFRRIHITTTEFAALQAIMFFDPDSDGLDSASQRDVAAEQKKILNALYRHICNNYAQPDASDRFGAILLRIPTIRKVAAKKNESLQIIDMFNLFNLNSLVKETALGIKTTGSGNRCPAVNVVTSTIRGFS